MSVNKEPLMRVRGLSKEFTQRRSLSGAKFKIEALNEVNLEIQRGATLAIIGESGAGKSTLARCLALLEKTTRGEILFDAVNVARLSRGDRKRFCRKVQLVFQNPASAFNPGMTAAEIIAEPLEIQRQGDRSTQRNRALELMEQVGMPAHCVEKFPREFSGGQLQRLAIARALALGPELLIFDEAFSNLDLASQQGLLLLLRELQAVHGLTYVHISHDLSLVADCADEIAVIRAGTIAECLPAANFWRQSESAAAQELLSALPEPELAHAGAGSRR